MMRFPDIPLHPSRPALTPPADGSFRPSETGHGQQKPARHSRKERDRSKFAEHWSKDLDRWFKQGVDTPDLVMIEVRAQRLHYWDGEDEGEVPIA